MRQRYRLYRRKKGGRYYIHDIATGKQESLGTSERATALPVPFAQRSGTAARGEHLNRPAYLAASDPRLPPAAVVMEKWSNSKR
jgi:hypothetical protein